MQDFIRYLKNGYRYAATEGPANDLQFINIKALKLVAAFIEKMAEKIDLKVSLFVKRWSGKAKKEEVRRISVNRDVSTSFSAFYKELKAAFPALKTRYSQISIISLCLYRLGLEMAEKWV